MKKYTIALIWLTSIGLIAMVLFSCSASYHFGKFIKKGGTIDTTERIVSVEKVIKVKGKDSIITVRVPVTCPEIQIPPTRTEIRYKYKLQRDSIQTVRYVTKWKTKQLKIEKKAETKQLKVNFWKWFFGGLAVGIWTALIIVYLTYKK